MQKKTNTLDAGQSATIGFRSAKDKELFITVNKYGNRVQVFLNTLDAELYGWGQVLSIAISNMEEKVKIENFLSSIQLAFVSDEFWGDAPEHKKPKLHRHQICQIAEYILYLLKTLDKTDET